MTATRLAQLRYQEMCHAHNHGPAWLAESYARVFLEPLPLLALCHPDDVLKYRTQALVILDEAKRNPAPEGATDTVKKRKTA